MASGDVKTKKCVYDCCAEANDADNSGEEPSTSGGLRENLTGLSTDEGGNTAEHDGDDRRALATQSPERSGSCMSYHMEMYLTFLPSSSSNQERNFLRHLPCLLMPHHVWMKLPANGSREEKLLWKTTETRMTVKAIIATWSPSHYPFLQLLPHCCNARNWYL